MKATEESSQLFQFLTPIPDARNTKFEEEQNMCQKECLFFIEIRYLYSLINSSTFLFFNNILPLLVFEYSNLSRFEATWFIRILKSLMVSSSNNVVIRNQHRLEVWSVNRKYVDIKIYPAIKYHLKQIRVCQLWKGRGIESVPTGLKWLRLSFCCLVCSLCCRPTMFIWPFTGLAMTTEIWILLCSSISIWAPLRSLMELILDPPLAMMRPAPMLLDGTETSQQTRNKAGGGWWSRSGSTSAWGLRKLLQKAERRDPDILFSATPPDAALCWWCSPELGTSEGGARSRYDTLRLCPEWSQIWEWMDFCHYSLCKPRVRWPVTPSLMLHTAPPTILTSLSMIQMSVWLSTFQSAVVLGDVTRSWLLMHWCKELIQARAFQETVLLHFLL